MSIAARIIVLYLLIVLVIVLFSILTIICIIQKESNRKLKNIRKKTIDLLLAYSHEYYVPLTASTSQAYSALSSYRKHPSSNTAFIAFWHYCYYLYHVERLFASGIPLPYKDKNEGKLFSENIRQTQGLFGLSQIQKDDCISALKSLNMPYHLPENFDCTKNIIHNKLTELKPFEVFLSVEPEKLEASEKAFLKFYSQLSHIIDSLFNISQIQTSSELFSEKLKELWREIRDLKTLDKVSSEPETQREISNLQSMYILTSGLLGIAYMTIFFPLVWNSAEKSGLEPLSILFFTQIGPLLRKAFELNVFPNLSSPDALPTVYAIGACTGILMFSSALVLIADPLKVGLIARGLVIALGITTFLGYIMGTIVFDSILFRLFIFKFGYLLATFMILSCLPGLLGRKGLYRTKYEKLFNGLYGIIAGWLLSKGFGTAATIYNSILFFVSWFIAIAIVERFVTHNPGVAVMSLVQLMSLSEFGKRVWAERREIFPPAAVFIIATLLLHFLIVVIYKNLLSGRF